MLDVFLQIILFSALTMVFVQDLKYRAIHILLPAIILIVGLIIFFRNQYLWVNIVYSSMFLCFVFVGLFMYTSIKKRAIINPFKQVIGIGDVLFFIAVIPFFAIYNYILFFITGMLFSVLGFLVMRSFVKTELVPLAGLLALYLMLLKIISYIQGYDIFFNTIFW